MIHVPLPDSPWRIRFPYRVGNLPERAVVLVDGEPVQNTGAWEKAELVLDSEMAQLADAQTLDIAIRASTWSPADAGGSADTRKLSVMVRDVVVEPLDMGEGLAGRVGEVIGVGAGAVISSMNADATSVADTLVTLVRTPEGGTISGLSDEASLDGQIDRLYVTVTTQDVLIYNGSGVSRAIDIGGAHRDVPPHSIVSVPRE
jgi:hypothetical protein